MACNGYGIPDIFKCDVCVNIFVTIIRDDLRTVISLLSVYLQQFQLSGQF